MAKHAQMVEPHRISDVNDHTTVPEGVGLGVLSNLGADHGRPYAPDLMLANPTLHAKPLQGAGDGIRDLYRLTPARTAHPFPP